MLEPVVEAADVRPPCGKLLYTVIIPVALQGGYVACVLLVRTGYLCQEFDGTAIKRSQISGSCDQIEILKAPVYVRIVRRGGRRKAASFRQPTVPSSIGAAIQRPIVHQCKFGRC